jgi:hypothetical protein
MRGHQCLGLGRAGPSSPGEYRMVVCVDAALQTVPEFGALRTQGRRQTMGRGGRAHRGACVPWFEVSGRAGRGGGADGLLMGERQILPRWCFQDARDPIPVESRLMPCFGVLCGNGRVEERFRRRRF